MSPNSEQKPVPGEQPAPLEQPAAPQPEPGPPQPRSSRIRTLGVAVLAILLYLVLIDAAIETFLSGSPVRWIIAGAVAAYSGLSVLLWRRLGWTAKAIISFFVILGLLAITAWLPQGLGNGVTLARQPTSTILAVVTACVMLLAGLMLVRLRFVPLWGKSVIGLLAVYGLTAFALGIAIGTPYPDLFRGRSLWERLPLGLQGAVIGAIGLVPVAMVTHLAYGVVRVRGAQVHGWAVQALMLGMGLVIAAAGLIGPHGMMRVFGTLDGIRVHYASYGQGQEALVLVHGWTEDLTFWRLQVPTFERCRLLLVDLPGHGQSDKPRITYTPDLFARAVDAVLRHARVDRAIVVGHSLGGLVVRQFYRRYPEKTQAVVIVDGTWGPLGSAGRFRGPNYLQEASNLIDSLFVPETPRELRDEVKSKMLRTPQYVMVSAWEETNNPEIWREDRIQAPVLAVYAPFWTPGKDYFVRISTDLDYQVLPRVSHFLMLEKSNEFNQTLRAFLVRRELLKGCL